MIVCALRSTAQTLVLNEVSNGPAGTEEYIEFMVVMDTPVDPCSPNPPCMDIRGWIFDDNNGYHLPGSGTGIAVGALRFSSTAALWSCVPVGTLILVYNGGDRNPAIPADDVSLTDGNCVIITPVGPVLFETTSSTPQPVLCSDPGGWGPASSWNCIGLRNPGDCVRLADPSGCEVFCVAYGDNSLNPMIYFAGNGMGRDYYFNGSDPTLQANWSSGGTGNQTPGAANNAANAAYLAQFNPHCWAPNVPEPLEVTATSTDACGCGGSADASATGSVPGYTYEWYDDAWVAIGQPTPNATGLCPGTYHVIGTSSVGCSDTATVDLATIPGPTLELTSQRAACGSATGQACAMVTGGTGTIDYIWNDPLAQTTMCATALVPGDYSVTITDDAGCTTTDDITVLDSVPDVSVTTTVGPAACGSATGHACATVVGGGTATWNFLWDDPLAQTTPCATALVPGDYNVTVTDANGCTASGTATVLDSVPSLAITITTEDASCGQATGQACATLEGGGTATWDILWNDANAQTIDCATDLVPGDYTVTMSDANGCSANATATVGNVVPVITVQHVGQVNCNGADDGHITLTLPDDTHTLSWTGPNSFTSSEADISGLAPGTYTYDWAASTPCELTGSIDITEPAAITVTATSTAATCQGVCDGTLSLTIDHGFAPFSCTVDGVAQPNTAPTGICPGDHTIVVTDAHGCTGTTTVNVADGPLGPDASISPLAPLCVEAPAALIDAVQPVGTWSGAGIADNSSGLFDPALAGPGDHWVIHRITGACTDADSILVHVEGVPMAAFITNPALPTDIAASVDLINTSLGASLFSWTVDGLPLAATTDATFQVAPGQLDYAICLIATGLAGCADTTCRVVTLTSPLRVFVPNTFTPDGDGINDIFAPVFSGTPPVECELLIFDRWGRVIHSAGTFGALWWDGTTGGSAAKTDVYVWRLTYRGAITGEQEALVGHVTLLR